MSLTRSDDTREQAVQNALAAWRRYPRGMTSRGARTLRGCAAGTVATLVAAASHGLGGGGLPGVAALALALTFSVMVSIALAGRRLPAVGLAASIGLSQFAFHVVFSTLGGAGEVIASSAHHGPVRVASAAEAIVHASPLMTAAHIAAAAITILAMVRGEQALRALRDISRMLLAAILSPASPIDLHPRDRRPSAPAGSPRVVFTGRDLVAACGLRGPPLGAPAA